MFGPILKEIRKAKGITQVEMEQLVGISQTAISQIETDHHRGTEENVKKMCEVLGISYGDLIIMNFERTYQPTSKHKKVLKQGLLTLLSPLRTSM